MGIRITYPFIMFIILFHYSAAFVKNASAGCFFRGAEKLLCPLFVFFRSFEAVSYTLDNCIAELFLFGCFGESKAVGYLRKHLFQIGELTGSPGGK